MSRGVSCFVVEPLERGLSLLMLDWCTNKDITRIATRIDPALLGSFVKAVMRIVSYIDIVRQVGRRCSAWKEMAGRCAGCPLQLWQHPPDRHVKTAHSHEPRARW